MESEVIKYVRHAGDALSLSKQHIVHVLGRRLYDAPDSPPSVRGTHISPSKVAQRIVTETGCNPSIANHIESILREECQAAGRQASNIDLTEMHYSGDALSDSASCSSGLILPQCTRIFTFPDTCGTLMPIVTEEHLRYVTDW